MIKGKRILLTGGCGFIGSQLTLRLCRDNDVVIVDSRHRDALRFFDIPRDGSVTVHQRDVLEDGALDDLVAGTDIVVHLAAIAGVSNYVKMPATTMITNVVGTHRVLEAFRGRPLLRFVNFSTSEVYGPSCIGARESGPTALGPLEQSRWTYATSKVTAEHLCFAYHRQYGLPMTSIRPFNIYGPGQVGEGAIHDISLAALRGDPVVVTGDGQQVRTWCYVDDMVDAALLAMESSAALGQTFNVGNAEPVVKMVDLARWIIEIAGSSSPLTFQPHIETDVRLRSPNVDRVRGVLGFEPSISLDDGLARTIRWIRDHLLETT